MATISTGGDLGDDLVLLASLKNLKEPTDLVLHPLARVREPYTREKVNKIKTFLRRQSYIQSVRYADTPEGWDSNGWRDVARQTAYKAKTLLEYRADYMGVSVDPSESWLSVDFAKQIQPVVIHRSPRFHGQRFPWGSVLLAYQGQSIFVGSVEEHYRFTHEHGYVPHHPTPRLIDLARVIAGCQLFIGNQSAPFNLALGLGKDIWLEEGRMDNCHYHRDNLIFGRQHPPKI
jgi:hypothetical protein